MYNSYSNYLGAKRTCDNRDSRVHGPQGAREPGIPIRRIRLTGAK
jgi:hypothetical protein